MPGNDVPSWVLLEHSECDFFFSFLFFPFKNRFWFTKTCATIIFKMPQDSVTLNLDFLFCHTLLDMVLFQFLLYKLNDTLLFFPWLPHTVGGLYSFIMYFCSESYKGLLRSGCKISNTTTKYIIGSYSPLQIMFFFPRFFFYFLFCSFSRWCTRTKTRVPLRYCTSAKHIE